MKVEEARPQMKVYLKKEKCNGTIVNGDSVRALVLFDDGRKDWVDWEDIEELLDTPIISKVPKKIDWEQRKYEISKSLLGCFIQCSDGIDGEKELAKWSVKYANALIKELKNTKE